MDEAVRSIEKEIPRLRRYAAALTGDPAQADVLVRAALERGLPGSNPGGLDVMRLRLLRAVYLRYVDGPYRVPAQGDRAAGVLPFRRPKQEIALVLRAVLAAVYRLPAEQRAALALAELEDMECGEVAQVLGMPARAVRSRLGEAHDTLRAVQDSAEAWSAWQRKRG